MIDPNEHLLKNHPMNGAALRKLLWIVWQRGKIGDPMLKQWQIDEIDYRHDDDCPAVDGGVCICDADIYVPKKGGSKPKY